MNITNPNIEECYSLSPLQEGILFHSILNDNNEYIIQQTLSFETIIDHDKLIEALDILFFKHEILRTVFIYEKMSSPMQVVLKKMKPCIKFYDLSFSSKDIKDSKIEAIKEVDITDGFDLSKGPLLKLTCVKTDTSKFKLIWTMHHIIVDGWSIAILFNDFIRYYDMLISNNAIKNVREKAAVERRNKSSYKKYIDWLSNNDSKKSLNHWVKELQGYDNNISLAQDLGVFRDEKRVECIQTTICNKDLSLLEKYARDNHITVNTIVECSLGILLQKLSGKDDVVYGKVVSGRTANVPNIDYSTGLYINTIPFRLKNSSKTKIRDLLYNIFHSDIENQKFEHCALSKIQDNMPQKNALINVLYCFENYYYDDSSLSLLSKKHHIKIDDYKEKTNYDITVQIAYNSSSLNIRLMYNSCIFSNELATSFVDRLILIIKTISSSCDLLIDDISINLERDNKILSDYNNTFVNYKCSTLHELFIGSAKIYPENIAIIHNNNSINYKELFNQASRVCHYIKNKGYKKGAIIAVSSERKIETVIIILGILMSGCAYVPINDKDPIFRQNQIIQKCGASLVIDSEEYNKNIKNIDLKEKTNFSKDYDSLAYVIFTSGSTGAPKGVMISHRAAVNTVLDINKRLSINCNDNLLCLSSFCFDLSVYDIFGALSVGATLTIIDDAKDFQSIHDTIITKKITLWNSVPAIMDMFIDNIKNHTYIYLKHILLSGDWIPVSLPSKINNVFINAQVYSLGGATEASIWSIIYPITTTMEHMKSVPYGTPLSNQQMFVLDNNLKQCPIDVEGEIYIAGEGVANGYINDTELSKRSFINSTHLGLLYKTGDLGVIHRNGQMEIIGRIDNQIKLNGFRIELGDIENNLKQIKNINNAAVIYCKAVNKLIGFITSSKEIGPESIKKELQRILPYYMVPSAIIKLEHLPINSNGKIDREELLKLYNKNFVNETAVQLSSTEELLFNTICEIINIKHLDVNANFLEIGLDSINTIKMVGVLKKRGIDLSIKDLFLNPTISSLAEYIDCNKKNKSKKEMEISSAGDIDEPALCKMLNNYKQIICESAILNTYTPNYLQLEHFPCEYLMLYTFSVDCNINDLLRAVLNVVREQPSFRTTYMNNNNKFTFVEREICNNVEIPCFTNNTMDNMAYNFNFYKLNKNLLKELFSPGSPLVIPFIVKLRDSIAISIIANHSVWDLKSNEIFQERVKYYLENNKTTNNTEIISDNIWFQKSYNGNINDNTFYKVKQEYENYKKSIQSKYSYIIKNFDTDTFLNCCNYDVESLALKLLKVNHKMNSYIKQQIPFYLLHNGRNESNKNVCGFMVKPLLQIISSDINKVEKISEIQLQSTRHFENNYNFLPVINISIELNESGASHINETIQTCNYELDHAENIPFNVFIRINKTESILAIFTTESVKPNMERVINELFQK